MNCKRMFQSLVNYIDEGIIHAIISTYHTGAHMTTWAVQPTDYGNEVKILSLIHI